MDRRWSATECGHTRCQYPELSRVCDRVHHRLGRGTALAVHPGQLDQATSEGPDLRTSSFHHGYPARCLAATPVPCQAALPAELHFPVTVVPENTDPDDTRGHHQGQLHPEDA